MTSTPHRGTRGRRSDTRGHLTRSRVATVVVAAALLAACGSDNSTSNSSSGTTVALANCPFTGTKAATQGQGAASGTLSKFTSAKQGCTDSLTFDFTGPPPGWKVEYSTGPFTDAASGAAVSVPGPATLVVTFDASTYSGQTTPTTVKPDGLDYVTAINVVSGPNGSLQWILSLAQQADYVTSVSNVPSNFTLGIG